jgi:hypothetical protein
MSDVLAPRTILSDDDFVFGSFSPVNVNVIRVGEDLTEASTIPTAAGYTALQGAEVTGQSE